MSKFNKTTTNKTLTVNKAGGEAYKLTDKVAFVTQLLTSFVNNQYYRSGEEGIGEIKGLINGIADKKFVAKAAIYARNEFGMRSITHVVAGEIAKTVKGEEWTKNFYNRVVYRVDDITEILSYYKNAYGKPYPNSLKKGLAMSFGKFDGYQLAKYRGEGKDISLVDAVNYLHPTPNDKNRAAIAELVAGTLRNRDTWESKVSAAGKAEDKDKATAEAWKELIETGKIGYFALLRNLRNVLEKAPEVTESACELLVKEDMIRKSLVLPFRYLTAITEIEAVTGVDTSKVRAVMTALNKAVDIAVKNVPVFEGTTLVVLDESGSMMGKPHEIGSLFSAILVKSNNADFMAFSDNAEYRNLNPMDSTLSLAKQAIAKAHGGGTNFHAIFQEASKAYDRIIILSDMQGWIGYDSPKADFANYKKRFGADPKVYSFDLAGYGTAQFPERNIYCLAGFSEKVFDIMKLLESDKNALVNEIEKIEI